MIELDNKIIGLQALDVQRLGHYWHAFFYLLFLLAFFTCLFISLALPLFAEVNKQ